VVTAINNRRIAQLAKLAGAPRSKAAGIELLTSVGTAVEKGQPLYIIHSNSSGELKYALSFLEQEKEIVMVGRF
jgi:thymidine phosphorylase